MENNDLMRASQRINATNPGQLNVQNASSGGIGDVNRAANAINASNLGQNLGRIQSGAITGAATGMGSAAAGAGTLDEISQDAMQNSSAAQGTGTAGNVNVEALEEASDSDFMQLMYEQAAELDAVHRISQERKNWQRQS